MRARLVALSVLLLTGCVSTPTRQPEGSIAATPAQIEAGRLMAESKCSACHAIGATGPSPLRAAPAFHRLSERYAAGDLVEVLREGIVTGHPSMPDWVFSSEEIGALVAYVQSIQAR